MKQREPVTSLLLSLFVPFYLQYWLYVTANEFRSTQKADTMPKGITLLLPTIAIFVFWPISLLTSFALVGTLSTTNKPSALGLILSLGVSLVIYALIGLHLYFVYHFCKAINQVVNVGLSPGILTLLFAVFSPIVVYLVQEKLNHLPPSNAQNPIASPIQ